MNLTENNRRNFWKHVSVTETCWLWTAYKDKQGYGQFSTGSTIDNTHKVEKAHRVSWTIHFGEIPEGLFVLHHCDNEPCLNPGHLFLGTDVENTKDKVKKRKTR